MDFTQGASDVFTAAEGTTLTYDSTLGAAFTIKENGDAPTITSKDYIFFGKIDAWIQASPGTGIVTSFVLLSDDLDEIDWEWLGGDSTQVQTNYFSKGNTTTYTRGGTSSVNDPQTTVHKYSLDWQASQLTWSIDDTVVRTLTYDDADNGATYPQTPMQIKLGTWVGGAPDAPQGTVEWAGGYTDFSKAPFTGYFQKLEITDYSNGKTGATSYVYGDDSGTYQSIVVNTDGSKDTNSSTSASSSAAASGTTSTAASSSSSLSSSAAPTTMATVTTSSYSSNSTSVSSKASANATGSSTKASATTSSSASSSSASQVAHSASGKVAPTLANVVIMGAAVFLGSLFL